jgi:hypothetical protein
VDSGLVSPRPSMNGESRRYQVSAPNPIGEGVRARGLATTLQHRDPSRRLDELGPAALRPLPKRMTQTAKAIVFPEGPQPVRITTGWLFVRQTRFSGRPRARESGAGSRFASILVTVQLLAGAVQLLSRNGYQESVLVEIPGG